MLFSLFYFNFTFIAHHYSLGRQMRIRNTCRGSSLDLYLWQQIIQYKENYFTINAIELVYGDAHTKFAEFSEPPVLAFLHTRSCDSNYCRCNKWPQHWWISFFHSSLLSLSVSGPRKRLLLVLLSLNLRLHLDLVLSCLSITSHCLALAYRHLWMHD